MNKRGCILAFMGIWMFFTQTEPVAAQGASMNIIYGSVEDAEKILQTFLEPYANVLGADLNAGWYNTAKPHQLGGISVTANLSWAMAPSALLSYDVSRLKLSGQLVDGTGTEAPTVAGSMDERPFLSYTETIDLGGGNMQEIEFARFELPDGAGLDWFPLVMPQISIGLPLGTDISVRFMPSIQFQDYANVGLWGLGGRHSLSQWIPGLRDMEFLNISLQGGYTRVTAEATLDVTPLDDYVDVEPEGEAAYNWDDQFVDQVVEGWTANLIASQKVSVLTFYEGIGYASSMVEMGLRGHFPVHTVIASGPDAGKLTYEVLEDPITLDYQNINNLRINLGARLKLGGFILYYDFTYTLYTTHTVGLGISFR